MTGAAPPGAQRPGPDVRDQCDGHDAGPYGWRSAEPDREGDRLAYEVVADLLARVDGRRAARPHPG